MARVRISAPKPRALSFRPLAVRIESFPTRSIRERLSRAGKESIQRGVLPLPPLVPRLLRPLVESYGRPAAPTESGFQPLREHPKMFTGMSLHPLGPPPCSPKGSMNARLQFTAGLFHGSANGHLNDDRTGDPVGTTTGDNQHREGVT